jgi:hypothetical protein
MIIGPWTTLTDFNQCPKNPDFLKPIIIAWNCLFKSPKLDPTRGHAKLMKDNTSLWAFIYIHYCCDTSAYFANRLLCSWAITGTKIWARELLQQQNCHPHTVSLVMLKHDKTDVNHGFKGTVAGDGFLPFRSCSVRRFWNRFFLALGENLPR